MLVADIVGNPGEQQNCNKQPPGLTQRGLAPARGTPREGGHQNIKAVGVDLILTIRRISGYDTTIPLFLATHPCWRGILEGVMDGKAKETVPFFLFIGEHMPSEANRKGVSRTLLKERGSFQHVLLPWRPGHGGSSRFLFPLPGLLPTFTSHCPCGHHAIRTQVHSTVAFPEQPLLIHGREGVTTQLPKHKQMRSKILTCFNRKEGGEGLWVRDVHGNTTMVGMWGRTVVAWPFSGGGVEDGTF